MTTTAHTLSFITDRRQFGNYRKFVPREWAFLLEEPTKAHLMIGLEFHHHPAGLCICTMNPMFAYCDISFLSLEKEAQQGQNYLDLFKYCAEKAKQRGIKYLTFLHAPQSNPKPLNETLERMHWQKPRLLKRLIQIDSRTFHPSWLHTPRPLPPEFEIFPWAELPDNGRFEVKKYIEQRGLPDYLSPFNTPEFLQPLNSLGLRLLDGQVIGWMVCHTFPEQPDLIQYSSFYIDPEFQRFAYAIQLLREAIYHQQAGPLPQASFEINLRDSSSSWLKFVDKQLCPYADKIEDFVRQNYIL